MTDSGPTTVGSILARLRMDRDQWVKDVAETKADARELGALRPTIRVDMDTASAMAQIESLRIAAERAGVVSVGQTSMPSGATAGAAAKVDAVAAAERRLAAAESASESATARATVAEMRLEEIRERVNRSAAQMAAAELSAAEAIKRSETAATKAALAEEALAASQDKASRSTAKANDANSTTISRMGLITTAVSVLLPMMVPLAAAAVGIAGSLTMMGVAGVLALVGIKREMADGTTVGNQYAEGIGELKGDLDQLSRTSATAMLTSFKGVVGDTNAAMPMLNRQVGEFSTLLGKSGGNLFSGALNGARVLEPLLLTVGVYLDSLTAKFNAWTSNGGLQKFANYAMSALPQVERVLGAVANVVMHILEALAPLGSVGLTVLTTVSEVISAIPVDVLSNLLGVVIWGSIAFKAWGFIAPMLAAISLQMGAVGAATAIATGPIGWIAAAVGALAAVFAIVASNQQRATEASRTYTAAVQADSGVIGENVRASAAKALQDAGAFAAAQKLGISTKLITDATLGDTSAKKELNKQLAAATAHTNELIKAQGGMTGDKGKKLVSATNLITDAVSGQNVGIKQSIDNYNAYQQAIGGTTISTKAQRSALEAEAAAAGTTVAALLAAKSGQVDAGAATAKTTALMFIQNDAAGLLKQSLDLLNGKTLSAAQAQNQFDSQIANMSDHLNAAGNQIDRANTLLDGNTAAAVKNRGELISLAQAAENNAQAFRDNGGSAEDTMAKLNEMKQAIVDNAAAHGENRAEVQQYIDTIFKIPATIPPTKIDADTSAAMAKIAALNAALNALSGKEIVARSDFGSNTLGAKSVDSNGLPTGLRRASGGTVNGPGSSTSDSVPLWASVGEEVIQASAAAFNRPFLKAYNANPAAALKSVAGTSSVTNTTNHINLNGPDPEAMSKDLLRRLALQQANAIL
jgi:hypothetical protein